MTQPDKDEKAPDPQALVNNPLPERFKPVTESASIRNVVRDPAGSQVTRTGRTALNVAASEIVADLAFKQYGGIDQCGIVWGPDEKTMEIGGYIAPTGTSGLTPIRRETDGSLLVYLATVFKKHPKLRPSSAQWCSFTLKPEGYFIIHLDIPLDRVKPSRSQRKPKPGDRPDGSADSPESA